MNLCEEIYHDIRKTRVTDNSSTQIAMRVSGEFGAVMKALKLLQQNAAIEDVQIGGKHVYKALPGTVDFSFGDT